MKLKEIFCKLGFALQANTKEEVNGTQGEAPSPNDGSRIKSEDELITQFTRRSAIAGGV